jgi:phage gp36-like protein
MAFLKSTDYDVQIRSEISTIIDNSVGKTKLKLAEDFAVAQMKNYLGGRYNLDLIFIEAPADGDIETRDPFMIMTAIDLALYHLWSKEGGNNIPQTRTDRYADALEWLKAVQKGAATNLPVITDDDDEPVYDVRIKSRFEPENNRY